MGKKLDAVLTALCLLAIIAVPVLRSGTLAQVWEQVIRFDMTGLDLRSVSGLLFLGVQAVPAFWFACLAEHYVTNMLILTALALFVIVVRKAIQRKTGEEY